MTASLNIILFILNISTTFCYFLLSTQDAQMCYTTVKYKSDANFTFSGKNDHASNAATKWPAKLASLIFGTRRMHVYSVTVLVLFSPYNLPYLRLVESI